MSKSLTPSPLEKSVDFNGSFEDPLALTTTKGELNSQDNQDTSVDFNGSFEDSFALTPKKQPTLTPQSEGSYLGASEREQFDRDQPSKKRAVGSTSLQEIPISPITQTHADSLPEDTRHPRKALFSGKEDTTLTEEQNHFASTSKETRTPPITRDPFTSHSSSFSTEQIVEPSYPNLSRSNSTPTTSHTSKSHSALLHSSHSLKHFGGRFRGGRGQYLKRELLRVNQKGANFTTTENSTSTNSNPLPTTILRSSSSSYEEADDNNLSQQSISFLVDPYDIHTDQDGLDDSADYILSSVNKLNTNKEALEIHDPHVYHVDPTHDNSFIIQQDIQRTHNTLASDLIKKILKAFKKSSISDENIYLIAFHKSLLACSEKVINDSCHAENPAIENLFPSDHNNVLTLKHSATDLADSATILTLADGKISGNPTADSIMPFVRIVKDMETEYLKSLQVEMIKKALKAIKNSNKFPTHLSNFRQYVSDFSDDEIEYFCDNPINTVTSNLSISLDEQDDSLTLEYLATKDGSTSPKVTISKDKLSSGQTEDSPESFLPFTKALKIQKVFVDTAEQPIRTNKPGGQGESFAAANGVTNKLKKTETTTAPSTLSTLVSTLEIPGKGIDRAILMEELYRSEEAIVDKPEQQPEKITKKLPRSQVFAKVTNPKLRILKDIALGETTSAVILEEKFDSKESSFGEFISRIDGSEVASNEKGLKELGLALNITKEDLNSKDKLKVLAALLISESHDFEITKKKNSNIFKFVEPDGGRGRIDINLIVDTKGARFTCTDSGQEINVNSDNAKELLKKVAKFIKRTRNPISGNVDQVLATIDKQEQDESSLCSKIKVSKITAVEIPKSSRLNQIPPLLLFRPELVDATSTNEASRFDFSTTKRNTTLQSSKDLINKALAEAIQKSEVTQEEAAKLILIAIKNGGINNAKEQLALDLGAENSPEKIKQAVKFSKIFQEEMKKASMFTGNQNAKELVGMRLKRLTPDYALDLLQKSNEHVQPKANSDFVSMWKELEMDRVIKITPTPIVEQASSSATKTVKFKQL